MLRQMALACVCAAAVPCVIRAQAHGGTLSDPQIVGIVVAANQIDIDHAKLAMSKAKDAEVRAFVRQMMTDHEALQKSVSDLGAKLKVEPAESDTENSLKAQASQTTQKLSALNGKAFEKAYIDDEVAYHQAVIHAVSSVLIPGAQNAELKAALQGAAPLFQGHLEHAQRVQADLAGQK